ncbi:alpha/beta hydrolase domain-containing protein [Solirubrobacter soli]|uniref:alpha/beta hydrolase domain-containing protein n=1 Tax=Solirubrobacter soli TaxID=363832 RepID=UPI0012F8669F|nr:alpha/beta hydrolase domain-containing protein [Solirubrobacter soli]
MALTASAGLAGPAAAVPPGPNGETPRVSTATGATVPAPAVTGPIANTSPVGDPAHGYPFLTTDVDLAKAGYVEQEFLISGQANRYTITGTNTATVQSTGNAYNTRLVVRRPVNAAKFNGGVIAEWYNVSNNWDQEVDWYQTHEHLLQRGYAWVGVSAQRVGLHAATTGLKAWSPTRYGALDVTVGNTVNDDSLSYDIFSQAIKAVRSPAGLDPLGTLPAPDYVIATGHSQSATRLRTYANSIQPLANIVDAVVLHGGGGAMRTDTPTPIFRLNSEGDISGGIGNGARAADSPTFRNWEVAGASHGDWKLITDYGPLRKRDVGSYPGGYPGEPQTCALTSLSRVPQHMVQDAVYDHTFNWVAYGIAPPSAPVITTATPAGGAITRDSLGLALGGIRLAQQDAPLRINTGTNTGPGFCFLDGSSTPMTDAQLATLYPTVQSYVDKVKERTLDNAAKGYIPADFTRDPAWYTDIRDLVNDYGTRIPGALATRLKASAAKAEEYGTAGDHYTAIFFLDDIALQATLGLTSDAAARDAVLRPTKAISALLQATINAPTSTSTQGTVGGTTPATLALSLGASASFGAFTPGLAKEYTATTEATVTSSAGDATLSYSDPGRLTNGAFSLPEPLRVELAKSAWTAPTSNEKVAVTFKQAIKASDALRTGAYSKTLTFTLSTTTP